ncbi:MAG TPA: hypothetical protein VFA44_09855 [Gaiellaceae bacterium]|nr:hypothetical protein [Gaiellaceae bacterium]
MGEPARIPTGVEQPPGREAPPLHDPRALERAYRYHRARRAVRLERRRERRSARFRFWIVLACLLLAVLVIAVAILQQIQNIFGV